MIAEVLPMTDAIATIEAIQDDCLEQMLRGAERAAIEAHRVAVAICRQRAMRFADAAMAACAATREAAPGAIGIWAKHTEAAVHTRNQAWFAASYAYQAGLCGREARTLGRRLAQLEARWETR